MKFIKNLNGEGDLKSIFEKVLVDYTSIRKETFKNNLFANYLRNEVPNLLNDQLALSDVYNIKASPGNGSWAWIPWIAVFNKTITDSVTSGIFLVYLFSADCSGIYLSISQGSASKKKIYGLPGSREFLRSQASLLRSLVLNKPNFDIFEKIDLKLEVIPKDPSGGKTGKRLGESYESCNIFATYYSKYSFPDNEKLFYDLLAFIRMYEEIIDKQEHLDNYDNDAISKDVWFEDLTKYSIHRRIERNQTLCKKAKEIHGYICQACNFNFEEQYGEVGKNFIEAHHKIPISNLEKTKIALDPSRDFMVLCSNCHRMIHRIKPIPNLEEFKRILKI